jgi:protocatechuate 3,4-dioxygenase beta subunit
MSEIIGYRRPFPGTQPDYLFPKYASTVRRAPTRPLVMLPHTLTELTGPMFGYDELKPTDFDLTKQHKNDPIGERIIVSGRVLDENGRPVPHTLVEIWQANASGKYAHPQDRQAKPLEKGFRGFGRSATDDQGVFRFQTIKPGRVPGTDDKLQTPHIAVNVFMCTTGDANLLPGRPGERRGRRPGAGPGRTARHTDRERICPKARRTGMKHHSPGTRRNRLLRLLSDTQSYVA